MHKFKTIFKKITPIHLIFIAFILVTLWFQRHIFFDTYDVEYMHNYYSFSQWSIPLSSRIMGDSDLFAYSGYSLTNDFKPFGINPETPILAKLLFGNSIQLFGNQHYTSLAFLLMLILGMDLLAKKHFKFDTTKRIFLALFIFGSAEIQEQIKLTLLDLPQVTLFVWHLIFLFQIKNNSSKKLLHISLAGLLLGLMTATKFGLYTPFIILTNTWYLYKNKQLSLLPVLLASTVLGYILPYFPIIFTDGIVNFIQAQKWIVNFYLNSEVVAPIGMILITSFTGLYKGWGGPNWENIRTWNGEWALGILTLFLYLGTWIKTRKTTNSELATILLSLAVILLILLKIPFWPRYLIFFIPFFWLLIVNLVQDKKILFLLLVFPLITTSQLIVRSQIRPTGHLEHFNKGAYEELYNYFSYDYKNNTAREKFVVDSLHEYDSVQPYMIETEIESETLSKNGQELTQVVVVKLIGYSGEKTIKKQLLWKQEYSQWKIHNIETILEQKIHTDEIITTLCVNPVKVTDWGILYDSLSEYYGDLAVNFQKNVMQLVPRDYCIPVGEVLPEIQLPEFPTGIEVHPSTTIEN